MMMMSSSCFASGLFGGADAAMLHVGPEYTPHDGSLGLSGFSPDDGAAPAGQLQLARAAPAALSPEEAHGAYGVANGYGPSPSDVTVALPPTAAAKLAGDPGRSWIQEQYYCPTWPSGEGFRDPFTAAARELSLRLAAESSSTGTAVSLPDHSSDVSCSGLTHASSGLFPPPAYGGGAVEPHFSQVLSRSGYAHIVQQTLDEFVGYVLQGVAAGATGEASCPHPSSGSSITTPSFQSVFPSSEEHQQQKLRSDLLKLLQLVSSRSVSLFLFGTSSSRHIGPLSRKGILVSDKTLQMDQRCNQCLDEMQSAACKFGSMVRPGGGALSAPLAHSAVSATHRRLRARIVAEIAAATPTAQRGRDQSSSVSLADRERRWESAFIQKHWALRQLRRGDQQSWRPQRGLPEKSVSVLKAWMFENFLRP